MSINLKIFNTLFLAVFVTAMGAGLVAPLLPVYAHELGAGAFQIGLVFGAFSLTRSIFVPYFGKLSDRKGKKPLLTTGLFIYFFLSLIYTTSKSVEALIALRLGQGFASAMILPVAQAYVGMITPSHKEGRIMGLFNISLYGGLSLGPLLGGVVTDWYNIQISFLSMGALVLFGFLICLFFLPRETRSGIEASVSSKKAMSYLELIKTPSVFSLFAFRTCFTTCIGITWTFLPFLASTSMGLSSSAIGVLVMVNVFIAGLFQAPMGYLADRFSKKILVTAGGIIAVVSILYINRASSFGELVLANGFLGLAGGISFPAIMALGVIEGRRTAAMGSLMGLLALGHSLGMLIGPLLAGVLIDLFSLGTIFIAGAIIMGGGILVFLRNN
ncbi:MAG: MFS transporter [Deltaproteobacteria bacterium]|nr:MFS transporter [Deltaproteobacteria bacterium]MBW2116423.1 MFS transporter [Deltaproteobacteria bacterium]MBW2344559.1 MFS transporter [Deltaproteobacteria bacterium]